MINNRDGASPAEDDAPSCPESEASRSYVTIRNGDALDELRKIPDASIDAIVTDPPYELSFMGRKWDNTGIAYSVELWREALRVLKPGGHLVAFGGTRTYHRMACAVEDAGFEIRDSLTWLYGSGFPKSLDVGKAIDKAAGVQRERVQLVGGALNADTANGWNGSSPHSSSAPLAGTRQVDEPVTDAARTWQGWGTALKPAQEPIVLARRPLSGTVAGSVLAHGTGALNIDGTRVAGDVPTTTRGRGQVGVLNDDGWVPSQDMQRIEPHAAGRWPANVLLTHGESCADVCTPGCPVAELDAQSGTLKSGAMKPVRRSTSPMFPVGTDLTYATEASEGGASRFFPAFRYQAKAPAKERPKVDGVAHPTVKPLELMRWLVRLVTPPGGVVLDLFAGSGTTLQAAREEGFASIGIEREPTYLPLIAARLGIEITQPAPEPVVEVLDIQVTADDIEHDKALAELQGVDYVPWPGEPVAEPPDPILKAIGEADDRTALVALWRANRGAWTDEYDIAVKDRLSEIEAVA
jgi:DNA modification methylase